MKSWDVKISESYFVCLCIPILIMSSYVFSVREIMYLIPPILVSYVVVRYQKFEINWHDPIDQILCVIVLIFGFILLYTFPFNFLQRSIKEIIFVIAPLISVIALAKILPKREEIYRKFINSSFYIIVVGFIVLNINKGLFSFDLYDLLLKSASSTEGTLSLVFGVFSIYYLTTNDSKKLIISAVFLLLSSKRIAIAAFLLVLFLYMLIKLFNVKIEKNRKFIIASGLFVNIMFVGVIDLLVTGYLDDYIYSYIGVSPDFLLMGRVTLFQQVIQYVNGLPLFGFGFAYTSHLLQSDIIYSNLPLMHSDIIKFVIEVGIVPSIILYIVLANNFLKVRFGIFYFLYLNILSFTDNVNIYFEVMTIIYMMVAFGAIYDRKPFIELWIKKF